MKKFLFWTKSNIVHLSAGLAISFLVAVIGYHVAYDGVISVFGSHMFAKISALVCAIAVFFEVGIRKLEKIKPEHYGVLNFLGKYVELLLPAGDVWVPPFCTFKEINVGEQMVDLRDTEVYTKDNRQAILHLQLQITVSDAYQYALKLASMGKPGDAIDPVIGAMIGKVKAAVRLYCEELEKLQSLNEQKQDIINSVMNSALISDFAKWGINIESLIIRTVLLPKELIAAANAVEIEDMEKASETKDVQTLIRIGNVIKDGFKETDEDGNVIGEFPGFGVTGEKLLEAAQMQQKRISGTVIRGRGLAIVDDKK